MATHNQPRGGGSGQVNRLNLPVVCSADGCGSFNLVLLCLPGCALTKCAERAVTVLKSGRSCFPALLAPKFPRPCCPP